MKVMIGLVRRVEANFRAAGYDDSNIRVVIEPEALHNLMGVLPEYIDTYIAEVTRDYGSLDAYLATTLGVDEARKQRLRAKLVA